MQTIPTYKMPFYKRFAKYYQLYRNFSLLSIFALVATLLIILSRESVLGLVIAAGSITIVVLAIINIIKSFVGFASFNRWVAAIEDTHNHVCIYTGAPGSGKTLMQTLGTYYMAQKSWYDILWEYWLLIPKMADPNFKPDEDEREIIEAYEFYMSSDGIPCLSANYPIYSDEYKRYCLKFQYEHLTQQERVPYRLVTAIDEIGTVCNQELYKDRSNNYGGAADLGDTFRFCRQDAEWRMIGTEQEGTNIFKDVRRVVAEIKKFKGVQPVFKPVLLAWIYNFIKSRLMRHLSDKQAMRWSNFMQKFKRFLDNTGFLKVEYVYLQGSSDDDGNVQYTEQFNGKGKNFVLYVPCAQPVKYRSRIYRSAYKAIDLPIRLAVYKGLDLIKEDAQKMLKAETLKRLKEEREAASLEEDKRKYMNKLKAKAEMKKYGKNYKSNTASTE